MKRLVGPFCLAIGLAGCQQPQPAANPFMRTTVPPPATGQAAAPVVVDPYYPPTVPGPTPAAPTAPAPVVAAPPPPMVAPPPATGPPDKYKPTPGMVDFFYHQSSAQHEKAVDAHAPGYREGSTAQMRRSRAARSTEATVERSVVVQPPETMSSPDNTAQIVEEATGPAAARLAAVAQDKNSDVTKVGFRQANNDEADVPSANVAARIPITASGPLNMGSEDARPSPSRNANTLRIVGSNEPLSPSAEGVADAEHGSGVIPRMKLTVEGGPDRTEPVAPVTQVAALETVSTQTADPSGDVRLASHADPFAEPEQKPSVQWAANRPGPNSSAPTNKRAVATTKSASTALDAPGQEIGTSDGQAYSHAPNYERLRGRLEYSQIAKQWKLRYIPIDGQTDRYGGSVVLHNTPLLEGHKPGEFVSIQGSIGRAPAGSGSFSPLYELRQLEPLAH